ncbi:MAG TPA: peptidylprolyl isomerase [Rhizomicrobium sp.]|jgi:peptidyl-prolyl cis-trans isomerase A (cyclophilin A)/peptidyl-prolyl cis-trans isomerase B (cyclophilin B)|nr:peptidylprolyl isomerase [Rhizomicrobium sp.]
MMAKIRFGLVATAFLATSAMAQPAAPGSGSMATPPPQAKVETSLGTFTILLDRINAPKSVANFIAYARERHYDGTTIYRAAPGFVIQMGSFEPGGASRAVHAPIPLETANGLKNVRGSVAMARQNEPASATAEFFVNLADNPDLDAKAGAPPNTTGYTVFGRVRDGMDVVDKIAAVPLGGKGPFPPDSTPATPIVIKKVTILESPAPNPPSFAK